VQLNHSREIESYIWSNVHTLLVGKPLIRVNSNSLKAKRASSHFGAQFVVRETMLAARCSATTETVALTLELPGSKHVDRRESASKLRLVPG